MGKFYVFGVAAIVVAILYVASSIFLVYNANSGLHSEIDELEENTFAEVRRLNESIRTLKEEQLELMQSIAKLTKAEEDFLVAYDNATATEESSLMCVAPYGTSFYPLLPYYLNFADKTIFKEVNILEKESLFFGTTHSGSWGDLDGGKLPVLLLHNYNDSAILYTYNYTLPLQDSSTSSNISNAYQNKTAYFQPHTSFGGPVQASCWGDFNKDGWEDLLVVGNGIDRLYMNVNGTLVLENVPQFTADYGEGNYCEFLDVTRDMQLDIIRMNASNHITVFRRIPKQGWEDITEQVGLPPTVKIFVGLGFFEREPTIVVVTSDDHVKFYDGNQLPLLDITDRFNGIPHVPNLVDVVMHDVNADRMFDILLLGDQWAPTLVVSEGEYFFHSFELPSLPELYGFSDALNVELAVADFNNDMMLDIFVVRRTTYANAPNLLYMNTGKGFEVIFNAGGAAGTALGRGESVSIADFNFDGFIDLAVFNGGGNFPFNVGPTQLFLNSPNQNNWIEIEVFSSATVVKGDTIDGLGAVVGVKIGELTQIQVIHTNNKHKRLHFGIGNNTVISKILIFYPQHHASQVYYGIAPNQLVTILDFVAPLPDGRALELVNKRGPHAIVCDAGLQRLKPSFFILGIWKAGTTSLSATLYHHPQITQGAAKEYYYYTKYHETLPIEWYWGLFPCGNASWEVSFDGTAGYMFDRHVPELLHPHHPNAKFIIMLRDPIARAYSHFYMTTRASNEEGPQMFADLMQTHVQRFHACAAKEGDAECAAKGSWLFLNAGLYYYAVQRWFKYFAPEQFIFVQFNDLVGPDGDKFVKDIQVFLGLEVYDLPSRSQNVSPKRAPMLNSTRTLLLEFYRPHNKLLYDLLHTDYKWEAT